MRTREVGEIRLRRKDAGANIATAMARRADRRMRRVYLLSIAAKQQPIQG
jgi:hypothetical protein